MALLDFIFRRTKKPPTQANGTDGVASFNGRLTSFELSPDLQGRNLYLTLTNMIANTSIVATGVRYYQNLIGGTSWTVTPKEGSGAAGERAADIVREGLFEANMAESWATCVKRQSLSRMFGFAIHEWVIRRRNDGMVVFASIEHRPQSSIEFWDLPEDGGHLRGIVQRPLQWGDFYYVPRNRLWYTADKSLTDSPDGVGLLRHVVDAHRRLQRYEQLEGFGYETDMRGIPVAKIPYQALEDYARQNGKSAAWVAAQVAPLETLVANHIRTPWQGITFDSVPYADTVNGGKQFSTVPQWALELLKGDGIGLSEIHTVIERINREIARVLGIEFVMMGGDGRGSNAQHADKTSTFAGIIEASLHELSWSCVHDLVYPLLRLNGLDPEEVCPVVMPDPIATERIETTVDALSKLASAGAVILPDDPAIDQIRRRLHLAAQPKLPPELIGTLPRARQTAVESEGMTGPWTSTSPTSVSRQNHAPARARRAGRSASRRSERWEPSRSTGSTTR